jgi:hypothetical protein
MLTIDDFTPGIFADNHAFQTGSALYDGSAINGFIRGKNGAAVMEDTYACCADPSGALGPLPARTIGRSYSTPSTALGTQRWPTGQMCYYVLDANIMGPAASDQFSWSDANAYQDLASENNYIENVAFGFFYASDGAGVASGYFYYAMGHQYQVINGSIIKERDFFFDATVDRFTAFPRDLPAAGLVNIRATSSATISLANIYIGLGCIWSGRWNRAVNTAISANDAVLTTADTDFAAGNYMTSPTGPYLGGVHVQYPDPGTPTGNTVWINNSTQKPTKPILVIAHQDRFLIAERESILFGTDGAVIRDIFAYGAIDDPKALNTLSRPFRTEFGSENVSGVGVMASISTDRLFIVKNTGGGYLVLGDLNNPTVQKLPFVESTYNVASYPANTPFGIVYGTRNGVFLWNGGQTTEKLSNQLEGFFWDVRPYQSHKYEGSHGRFAWWHPWVMVPNNFMFDSRTKSWWRLDLPITNKLPTGVASDTSGNYAAPYMHYVVNPANGKLHAYLRCVFPTQTSVSHVYDPEVLAAYYTWKSQPLVETRDRMRSFQQINIVMSGHGSQTVTVTLTGTNALGVDVTPVSEIFTWNNASTKNRPVVLKHNIKPNFVAMNVQVRIEVSCATFLTPSAKVHSIALGTSDRMLNAVDK